MDVSGSSWEDAKWWSGAYEEDTTLSLELEGEHGAWARGFLPPPPRPLYLESEAHPDGLTTCDLCTWATSAHSTHQSTIGDSIAALPWSITLVIVSVVSALIGATLMVTLKHCLRKIGPETVSRLSDGTGRGNADSSEGDKDLDELEGSNGGGIGRNGGLWCWIGRRGSGPGLRHQDSASNHYTVDEAYSSGSAAGEALYAELDKPVYQNTGYVLEAPTPAPGSPPSSAYYSDLSDRTYETVGLQQQAWEMAHPPQPITRNRLAAIVENSPTPAHSDYV